MLRDNGVSCYQYGGLTLYMYPDVPQGQPAQPGHDNSRPTETHQVGYQHPSLRLFSWPESKEGPK